MTAQLDLFEEFCDLDALALEIDSPEMEIIKLRKEMADLRKEIEAVRKSSDAVRRGVFARLGEVSKLVLRLAGCEQVSSDSDIEYA